MKRSWLLYIALGVAIFFAITYTIFFYWNIDDNNKLGTFFSFTSAFSIFATIGVYFWQRNDAKKLASEVEKSILKMIISECERVKNELNHAENVFSKLEKRNLVNITSKNNGDIFLITSVNENMRSRNHYLKRIELSSIENLLGLAISTNSKYFEAIYSMMLDIMRYNEELSLWLLSDNVIYKNAALCRISLGNISILIDKIKTTLH
ncbi:TPA: hypothetical protein ACKRFF_001195 [Providencia stuartii]|uniref:hypothetical protein n=1 Tax=Providencia TaxID=586 RepID=UPI000E01B3B7|nr:MULTISPECIES: hypothetical protein [Providencia]MBN5557243.1 hypothetical protein [Providencia stuartii]SUC45664.1 Uncharacterised protein [Providencia stuartii]HEM8264046.1 hypothetical protein [Providencia stuartii]HEM8284064.1 hypothetical protein [Providencia stuartii]